MQFLPDSRFSAMTFQLLLCVPPTDDSALGAFQALREACRSGVRQHSGLGAALLFTGSCTMVLVEGGDTEVRQLRDALVARAGPTDVDAWCLQAWPDSDCALAIGACKVGYLDDADGCESLRRNGPADTDRVQGFLRMWRASDHD